MLLKLNKIAVKPFVLIVGTIQVVAGFILGLIVTLVALVAPSDQVPGVGPWSIIVFPILNGLIGVITAVFLAGIYNVFSKHVGGVVFEFENV
jgi:hypothetical protein